jgi:hypothetical protein
MPEDNPKKEVKKISFNGDKRDELNELDNRFFEYYNLFQDFERTRNQNIHFFNKNGQNRNIIDYVKDSVDRMNEVHLKQSWKEEWQNNVFDPITRDKLIAILSKLASSRMKPELVVKPRSIFFNEDTLTRRQIYSDLLEAANNHNDEEYNLMWEMYTAMSEGTVFGFESWLKDTREVSYIKNYDPDTGKKEVEKIKINAWDDVYGEIIPIEEFYPETVWVNNVKKLNRCFWRRQINYSEFERIYKKFGNYSKVKKTSFYRENQQLPYGISNDVKDNNVELLMSFDKLSLEMGIWANGVELYFGPMPWNHRELPVWSAQFEMIHHKFLYGKSLPDKLMGMQDIDNALFNAILDQLFIGLNSPIVTDAPIDNLGEGYLEPGRWIEAPGVTKVERLFNGNVDSSVWQMLSMIKRNMEESSISSQAHGVPTGGRKTKYEVQQLQEGALTLAGLFLQLMERAIAWKYYLRMHNILQYYSMPNIDHGGSQRFKFIMLENAKLLNGKVGTKMIQVVNGMDELQNPESLRRQTEKIEGKPFDVTESRVQPIMITRDYLLNKEFDLEVKIVPNSSVKETEVQRKNDAIAFSQFALGRPDLFDQELAAKQIAEALNQPEDMVKVQQQQPMSPEQNGQQGGMPGGMGAGMPGMPALPNVDIL